MRNMSEIIEDCKLNKAVDNEELIYTVLTLVYLTNMSISTLRDFYEDGINIFKKMRIDNASNAYSAALGKSPKDFVGWNNDPKNPEYQKFHELGNKLFEKASNGELPNQKQRS